MKASYVVFGLLFALMLTLGLIAKNAFQGVADQRATCSAQLQAEYPKMGAKYADRFCATDASNPHYAMGK